MNYRQPVTSYFDKQAQFWRDLYNDGEEVYAAIHRERREWALDVINRLDPLDETMVLEVGVGAGGLAVAVAAMGLRVVGVDGSAQMLHLTRAAAEGCGTVKRVVEVQADASTLPFHDQTFPLVMGLGLLPWVPDAAQTLSEMARVAAPGGHVVVTADNTKRLTHTLDPRFNPRLAGLRRAVTRSLRRRGSGHVRATGQSRGELERMCRQAGLEILSCQPLGFGPFTFGGRRILPRRTGRMVHAALQRWAMRDAPVLRSTSCQHLVLARRLP